jgi:hypothetical protein
VKVLARRVLLRRVVCSFGREIALPAQLLRTGANTLRFAGRKKEEEETGVILYLYPWITTAKQRRLHGADPRALHPARSLRIRRRCGYTQRVRGRALRGAISFVMFHLLVRGIRRMYGLPVVAVAALLLAGQVEAAEQWTVWSVQNDGTAVRVGREVVDGKMVHHDGTETECQIMAGEFQKSHWFLVADINKARAQRGEPSIKPRVTYECRRAR